MKWPYFLVLCVFQCGNCENYISLVPGPANSFCFNEASSQVCDVFNRCRQLAAFSLNLFFENDASPNMSAMGVYHKGSIYIHEQRNTLVDSNATITLTIHSDNGLYLQQSIQPERRSRILKGNQYLIKLTDITVDISRAMCDVSISVTARRCDEQTVTLFTRTFPSLYYYHLRILHRSWSTQSVSLGRYEDGLILSNWTQLEQILKCDSYQYLVHISISRTQITDTVPFSRENITSPLYFPGRKYSENLICDTDANLHINNFEFPLPSLDQVNCSTPVFRVTPDGLVLEIEVPRIFVKCCNVRVNYLVTNSNRKNEVANIQLNESRMILPDDAICAPLKIFANYQVKRSTQKLSYSPSFLLQLESNQTNRWIVLQSPNDDLFRPCSSLNMTMHCYRAGDERNTSQNVEFKNLIMILPDDSWMNNMSCGLTDQQIRQRSDEFIWISAITEKSPISLDVSTIVAITVCPLIILVIMIGVMFWLIQKPKKEQEKKTVIVVKTDTQQIYTSVKSTGSSENPLVSVIVALRKLLAHPDDLISEFKRIEQDTREKFERNFSMDEGQKPENEEKNRYSNIIPYDKNRVVLKKSTGDSKTTYINASLMQLHNRTFIATQAPKPNTTPAFWQMVWEQKITVIVMITELMEGNKRKADQYWPDDEHPIVEYGHWRVSRVSETVHRNYREREMSLVNTKTKKQRIIFQVHNVSWLDKTAPEETSTLLDILFQVEQLHDARKDTLLVHCSAGVGRTGSFIALYSLYKELISPKEDRSEGSISIKQTVEKMREQRMKMVQKQEQYVYLHKCLLDVAVMRLAQLEKEDSGSTSKKRQNDEQEIGGNYDDYGYAIIGE